jgi:S1-C subfamily serine protease
MLKRLAWLGILTSLCMMISASAKGPRAYSAEELFRRYKSAVVKIVIRQQLIPIGTGTGFFIAPTGTLVTNYHVMKSVLKTGSFTADFVMSDGRTIRDFKVANCRDDRGIDLCVLQLPVKPSTWFVVNGYQPSPGETVYAIGHPEGLDYSISNGIISAVRENPSHVEEVQVTAAISPGNSGGPIFNSRGTLVGVASKFFKEGQNLNFGITAHELKDFLKSAKSFVSLAQYRKIQDTRVAETVKKVIKEMIDPAYAKSEKGERIADVAGFKEVQFDFGDAKLRFPIPKLFTACERVNTKRGAGAFTCTTDSNSVTFSVSRVSASANAPLEELDGKKAVKEKPLPIVELLMQDGSLAEYESKLSAENKKYLFSVPGETKCHKLQIATTPQAFFEPDSMQCRFSIFNDNEPDAYSQSIWVQRGKYIYDFYIWMEDAGLADYMNHVPSLAVLGAQSGDVAPSLTSLPFKIDPVPSFTLLKSESLSDGTVTYLFSRSGFT